MTEKKQSEDSLKKPLLVYDEECQFCVRCVERLRHSTGNTVEYLPLQETEKRPSSVSREEYLKAVHLFIPGEEGPLRGAEAICKALAIGKKPALFFLYKRLPFFARAAEVVYRVVAKRRQSMSVITSILWGKSFMPSTYRFSSWLFGRTLGLVALVAFLSYWSQADGLVGPTGIMPFDNELNSVETAVENNPDLTAKEWLLPTLLWWSPTWDSFEMLLGIGALFAVLLTVGAVPAVASLGIWACYLSVMVVGSPFLSFQWDILLLETCLLSVFFLPWKAFSSLRSTPLPSRLGRLLVICLLFKLMFESGLVKFTYFGLNEVNAWRDLTALEHHYWTQPIPSWTSWYFDRLPPFFDKASLWFTYVVELVLPFFFFLPRNARRLAFAGQVLLQVCIMATGNYGFFNLLTLVLCLPLLDDQILPRRLQDWMKKKQDPAEEKNWAKHLRLAGLTPLAIFVPYLGWIYLENDFAGNRPTAEDEQAEPSAWRQTILQKARQSRSINSYGLFRVMTTTRPELIVEASMDGQRWEPYVFKWKPGDLNNPPEHFIPHMPRLDWQMWFEALNAESYTQNLFGSFFYARFLSVVANGGDRASFMNLETALGPQAMADFHRMGPAQRQRFLHAYDSFISGFLRRSLWFAEFLEKLAQAEPSVLALLEEAPFENKKPRFLRVALWQYVFASPDEKKHGAWWAREKVEGFEAVIKIKGPE